MTRFPAVYNSQESQDLQSIGQNLILLTYVIGLHPDWAILWEITLELWWIVSRISSFKAESKPVGDGTVATSILYILVYNLRPVKQHWAERPIHSKNKWRPLQWKAWRSITKQTHPLMFTCYWLQAVIACKWLLTKYWNWVVYLWLY